MMEYEQHEYVGFHVAELEDRISPASRTIGKSQSGNINGWRMFYESMIANAEERIMLRELEKIQPGVMMARGATL